MIFVTVGTQMPFDRLVEAVDAWAQSNSTTKVFAQSGPSSYRPRNIDFKSYITPDEFRDLVQNAQFIISHAGMGSILTSLEYGKRIIVMPRRADLGEHRNDHQLATAHHFQGMGRVLVASSKEEMFARIDELTMLDDCDPISSTASPELVETIRDFISIAAD